MSLLFGSTASRSVRFTIDVADRSFGDGGQILFSEFGVSGADVGGVGNDSIRPCSDALRLCCLVGELSAFGTTFGTEITGVTVV